MALVLPETVFLFQCADTEIYALSADKTGRNLPQNGKRWQVLADVDGFEIADELAAIVKEVGQRGFCLLHVGNG